MKSLLTFIAIYLLSMIVTDYALEQLIHKFTRNERLMLWGVAVYLLSVIVTNYALDNMLRKITGKESRYQNIKSASNFLKVLSYIPVFNTLYAAAWLIQFARGFFTK